jgi:hypothetical protein
VPRYFVDTTDGLQACVDRDGFIASDDRAARAAALAGLADMVGDSVPDGDDMRFVVRLRNSEGDFLYNAIFTLKGEWSDADHVASDFKDCDRLAAHVRPDRDGDKAR